MVQLQRLGVNSSRKGLDGCFTRYLLTGCISVTEDASRPSSGSIPYIILYVRGISPVRSSCDSHAPLLG